jgi:serine protease Do
LPRIVGQTRPGKVVEIEIWRNESSKILTLTVGEIPADTTAGSKKDSDQPATAANIIESLGLAVSDITPGELKQLGLESGVKIDRVAGSGDSAGLKQGDIVLALNNEDIKSVNQFKTLMRTYANARSVALLIQRGGNSLYIPIRLKAN